VHGRCHHISGLLTCSTTATGHWCATHRALARLERELDESTDRCRLGEQTRIAEIKSAVLTLKVPRSFEVDLHRLRIHLRMVEERLSRTVAGTF
jgi:hypothetical protein